MAKELLSVIKTLVPVAAQPDAWADVRAVLERFERCQAVDPDDVKPIAQDTRLWEMRLEISTYGLLIRIYETEIVELPGHIVALRAHQKAIGSTEEHTRELQDLEIAAASERWDAGREAFWGVP